MKCQIVTQNYDQMWYIGQYRGIAKHFYRNDLTLFIVRRHGHWFPPHKSRKTFSQLTTDINKSREQSIVNNQMVCVIYLPEGKYLVQNVRDYVLCSTTYICVVPNKAYLNSRPSNNKTSKLYPIFNGYACNFKSI